MKKEMGAFALVLAAVFLFVYLFNLNLTGFAVFEQNDQSAFDAGTYDAVVYDSNLSAVVLDSNHTSGTYTSEIFDAGNNSLWNNLTWVGTVPGNTTLDFEVRACSLSDCSNTSFVSADLNALNLTSQYFQYKASFASNNTNETLALESVSLDYSVVIESSNETNTTTSNETVTTTLSISEPSGTYSSGTGIPIDYTVEGANLSCIYNIEDSSGGFSSNTTLADCNASTFDIVGDEDYVFHLYVEGANGSVHGTSSFTLNANPSSSSEDTTSTETTTTDTESTVQVPVTASQESNPTITEVSSSEIASPNLIPGGSTDLVFTLQNTGTEPVSACALNPQGDLATWITSVEDSKNLNSGDSAQFAFTVNVPEDTPDGSYTLSVSADCAETASSRDLIVNVEKPKLGVDLISSERTKANRVRVVYELTELTGENQNVEVYFALLDENNIEVANATENRSIDANATKDFRINIPVNESLEGNLSLSGNFNSQVYSSSVLEPISLGAPIGGFAVFDIGSVGKGSIAVFVGLVVVFLVLFFSVRKMKRSKGLGKKKNFSKEDSSDGLK